MAGVRVDGIEISLVGAMIVKPRAVAHELANRDLVRRIAIGSKQGFQRGSEQGSDRCVQVQLPFLPKPQRGRGDEGLGVAGNSCRGIDGHGTFGLAVRKTRG